jgi:hypothetical protein
VKVSIYELPDGFVYQRGPIDHWWGWMTTQNLDEKLQKVVDHALASFRADGRWEGDIIDGPYIAGILPSDADAYVESEVMVAVKQANNGMVYVWSPQALPHLEQS